MRSGAAALLAAMAPAGEAPYEMATPYKASSFDSERTELDCLRASSGAVLYVRQVERSP
jgi:hypothetical protein